jgi:DNA recombination protein RmuC
MTTASLLPLIILAIVASCAVVACIVMGVMLGRRSAGASAASPWSDALVPVTASLSALAEQVQRTERENVSAQATLRTELTSQLSHHVTALTKSTDDVRREASRLSSVLGRTGARGRWGEMQLRRLVESAGMLERVHFTEQSTHQGDAGVVRPDMIINLAADRCIVVDAKVPLNAFLEAERSTDEATTNLLMKQHATDLIRHIDALQGRDYQRFIPNNCEFVVMFLPSESLLEAALDARPDLLDHAFSRNVVPATPTTLFALLRTVNLSWRQERLAQHAEEIQQLGKELHARLSTMAVHFTRVGSSLDAAVTNYNKTVGSLESRVLVTARAFNDFGVTDAPLAEIPVLTERVRSLSSPEMADAEEGFGHAPRIERTG